MSIKVSANKWPFRDFLTASWLMILFLGAAWAIAGEERDSSSSVMIFDSGTQQVNLLELYSSQGCSSCPPAEQWISLLKSDKRLWEEFIPLVFHVDYWDYLGWKDPYASLRHSQRQRMYQLHGHTKAVYTPGFILSGKEWTDWFRTRSLPEFPKEIAGQLTVKVSGDELQAKFIRDKDNRGLVLNVALLGFGIVTDVGQGENKGMRLPQDFVVLEYKSFNSNSGMWNIPMPETDFHGKSAAVFWVSQGSDPAPLQATGGWLPVD
ncbi:DUF1223 domain-containing protein [Aestuariicella sp. G3-2]|uniref:DUF1223 domain-containing protein n=1 Tax=Pseudomaricurvus albidus TaxID=2842452 RepID=UPI001C0C77AF|nr:DUF1223 domain-containing protein [Aestuariicella albida]MBU3071109.1 DUF1223 domain-containing protein [Aestuariicella albida]